MKTGNILILDDNHHILESLSMLLRHDFKKVVGSTSPEQIPDLLEGQGFDLVLLDMNFSRGASDGKEGLHWLKEIRARDPELKVVLMTAYGGVELAVKGMKEGAADFVLKPWNPEKLLTNLKTLLQLKASETKLARYESYARNNQMAGTDQPGMYECQSLAMQRIKEVIGRVGPTEANVLITGENGTGKELVARELHRLSHRSQELFVSADLGAITESLFESELFGHMKGSFTGAVSDRKGRFELASGGTLFLDEIGNVSLAMQSRLLSALEKREVVPVGSNRPVPVDIRLVSATNADIVAMLGSREFREDLYYRLNTITIHIPPLRERPEDVEGMAKLFLKGFADKYRKAGMELSQRAVKKLCAYQWPGNVRELKHAVEKAVILSGRRLLGPDDFFFPPPGRLRRSRSLRLDVAEKEIIQAALDASNGNVSQAASHLGITRSTLYAKMKKHDI
jgi:DNA-binding NtrC family response regulator